MRIGVKRDCLRSIGKVPVDKERFIIVVKMGRIFATQSCQSKQMLKQEGKSRTVTSTATVLPTRNSGANRMSGSFSKMLGFA